MTVTGPSRNSPTAKTNQTQQTQQTQQGQQTQQTEEQQTAGWSAGSGSQKSVNPNLAPPPPSMAEIQSTLPNPVRTSLQASVDRFTARIETTLNHDALSIARGKTPVREGDPLTEAQTKELQNATKDLINEVPIGALAPELAAEAQRRLRLAGVEVRDISSTRLKDLGKIGGDIANDFVKDLKQNSPTTYYSVAGGLAAYIGYTAWNQGSAKLNSLGIKPEVKSKFFDDHLEVKLKGDWQAHFKDFNTTATVTGRANFGDAGRLDASVSANSKTGFDNASVQYTLNRDHWNLSSTATVNTNGLKSVTGQANWKPSGDSVVTGSVTHDFETQRTTASLEGQKRLSKNSGIAASAGVDSQGEWRIGVGYKGSF